MIPRTPENVERALTDLYAILDAAGLRGCLVFGGGLAFHKVANVPGNLGITVELALALAILEANKRAGVPT